MIRIFVAAFLVCLFFAWKSPVFLTGENLSNILLASTTLCLLSVGASFVIGAAGIDLSVGSVMAVSAMTAVTIAQSFSLPWFVIPFLCLFTGLLCGLLNGWLIGYRLLPPFIVTLGTLGIFRGIALVAGNGRTIYDLGDGLATIGQGTFLSLPVPVIICIIVFILCSLLACYTSFGIHNFAIGDHEDAARLSGIHIKRHKLFLYGLSGLLASLAGLIFMTRINAADPNAGLMAELAAITAALLGGASLKGGKVSIIGAISGALLMSVLQNGLTLLNVPAYYQQLAIGIILIGIVALRGKAHAA